MTETAASQTDVLTSSPLCLSDALTNLVGQQNARYGIIKIFNALQETSANKHLLYVRSPCGPGQFGLTAVFILVLHVSAGADGNDAEGTVS